MEENLEQSEAGTAKDNQDVRTLDPTQSMEDSKPPIILGKFASEDALAKAYEELQCAFTRKSQELALVTGKGKGADNLTLELGNNNAGAAEQKKVVKASDGEEIIKAYLLSVAAGRIAPAVITGSGGGLAFLGTAEANTIHATTKVVENFFKEKKL